METFMLCFQPKSFSVRLQIHQSTDKNYFQALEIYFKSLEIYFSALEIYFRATEKKFYLWRNGFCSSRGRL